MHTPIHLSLGLPNSLLLAGVEDLPRDGDRCTVTETDMDGEDGDRDRGIDR